jgi:hypothetical protein
LGRLTVDCGLVCHENISLGFVRGPEQTQRFARGPNF